MAMVEKSMLKFKDGINPKQVALHTAIMEVCEAQNWDINCDTAAMNHVRLDSARLTDLEALRTFMFLLGTYNLGEMFATADSFSFWAGLK